MQLLDGKLCASRVLDDTKAFILKHNIHPILAVVSVGNDPASTVYIRGKRKDCEYCGIGMQEYRLLGQEANQKDLLALIDILNKDKDVDGIIVQLPLPFTINAGQIIDAIDPKKDVDGFHPINVGNLVIRKPEFLPCTPAGIMYLLTHYNIAIAGKHAVVVGRSDIVGKPIATMLLHSNATVTICHSATRDLKSFCKQADILVSAAGQRNLITADMVKPGSVIVDVSMNHDEDGKLCGDVDFKNVAPLVDWITPVPGGIGPMTRAMLMKNTLQAFKLRKLDGGK